MDIFKLLKQDHKGVKNIFKKLQKTSDKARGEVFAQLERELTVHAEVEEELVYPRLKQVKKLRATANEAFEEHHVAKVLLRELSETSPGDERWTATLSVLKEMIEHHVEEEKELFPKASRALGKTESKELGKRVEAAKKEKLKSFEAAHKADPAS